MLSAQVKSRPALGIEAQQEGIKYHRQSRVAREILQEIIADGSFHD